MTSAVDIVQSYFRVNGFMTVTEYPIIHRREGGVFKEVTDVDVLAVRLPHAGRVLPRAREGQGWKMGNDSALDLQWGQKELIIAEVKEGVAKFNQAMFERPVLKEALRRFGACTRDELDAVVTELSKDGEANLADGTRIRLMGFGSRPADHHARMPFTFIPMSDVLAFLRDYIHVHWEVQNTAPFRDPVLRFLAILEKSEGQEQDPTGQFKQ